MMKGSMLRVGILGDGQLARMLAQAAVPLPIEIFVFAAREGASACVENARVFVGNPRSVDDLTSFFSKIDLAIFENEFVDTNLLREASVPTGVRFAPSLETVFEIQNKLRQKKILKELLIPSPRFFEAPKSPSERNLLDWVSQVWKEFGGECVFKWAELGYDGKGTCVAKSIGEAEDFCLSALAKRADLFCEERVDFEREVSLVSVFSQRGEFESYPLVVTEQDKGICHRVIGPARQLGVSSSIETQAQRYAKMLAEHSKLIGTFAIEFFLRDGKLWVNEIAPRVHNSGHFTLDASLTSQFENHLRAVSGYELGSTQSTLSFSMLNLVGKRTIEQFDKSCFADLPSHIHFHWYDKSPIQAGRKMGHINAVGTTPEDLNKILLDLEGLEVKWNLLVGS